MQPPRHRVTIDGTTHWDVWFLLDRALRVSAKRIALMRLGRLALYRTLPNGERVALGGPRR